MTKAEIVAEILKEQEGLEVNITSVNKDARTVQGLQLGTGTVRPVVYPEMMEGNYSEIVDKIMDIYRRDIPQVDTTPLTNWEKAKKHLVVYVRPVLDINDEQVVTKRFLDLEMFCRVHLGNDASVKVTWQLLNVYGVCDEVLFDTAINNSNFEIRSMYNTLVDLLPEGTDLNMLQELESDDDNAMFVGTNKETVEGAAILVQHSEIKKLADRLGSDLYILPSSMHEVLIKKVIEGELEDLRTMVKEVNLTAVEPEDRLSNSVYRYTRSTDLITIA